jgi:biopolymer transport protein ExbB
MIDISINLLAANEPGGFAAAWAFLQKGGIFMIPLGLSSIAGTMAILYKSLALSGNRVIPQALAREIALYQQRSGAGHKDPVPAGIEKGESTLARLSAVVLKHRGKSHGEITRAVESAAREETVHLHSGIGVLDTVITIAPLLGLIGTASGLVLIFQGLGNNSDHLAIARGISEALTTTIFGLTIAVPCVIAHGYFLRRIEKLTARLETLLADLASVCENNTPHA